jgi:guanylate kinase
MSGVNDFEGRMFIFTAPSGAGKTTIVKHLLEKYENLDFSISATTRNRRAYEVDGKDYYFKTIVEFKESISKNEFVEWEEVYENQFYGTLKTEINRVWSERKHLIFDIDVRGAQNLKALFKEKCMAVFVRPPSLDILLERLIQRNTETAESLEKRINKVKREMTFENSFDFVLVNDQLDVSFIEAEHIVDTFINGLN